MVIVISTDVTESRTLSPLVVGTEMTGTPVVPVAPLARKNKRESQDVTETLIGGNLVISIGTATNRLRIMNGEEKIRMVDSFLEEMASRGVPDMKEVGSVMTAIRTAPSLRKKRPRYGAETGAETGTVLTGIGPEVPNLNRILSGWILMIRKSPEGCTPRKTSNVGKKG